MKKSFTMLSMFTAAVLLLSACGASTTKEPSGKTAGAAETGKKQDAKSQVKLKFLTQVVDYPKYQDQINEALHKTYPNITVEFEHVFDNYDSVLKTKIATKDAPDLFNYAGYLAMKPFVDADQLLDLSNDKIEDLILPGFRDGGKYNGKTYAISTQVLGYGLIYNKEAFKDAGISAPPQTLSELKEDVDKLKKVGITPFASGFKDVWLSYHMFWAMQGATLDNFQQFYDDMNAGKTTTKTDKLVKAFELLDIYNANDGENPLSSDFSNMSHLVGTKKAAMALQGVWSYDEMTKLDPKVQLGLAPIPVSDDPKDATMLADGDGFIFISKDSKHPEEAKNFLRWMVSKEGAEATVGSILKQQSTSVANPHSDLNALSADVAKYIADGKKTRGFVINFWPSGLADIIGKEVQDYIVKRKTKDQLFENLDASWKKLSKK
ncbi:extracellular solute-binding protein [Paenibacillus alba]|uniref:ABC transporter substrate-binding protein n=1 Tax=Paenibacillus alba TaxID=1197127 RepID=UPI0015661D5D|nr:extracellular solute-binding protein [Paenibacillus alba]NQX66977.1 extracellular solute-binding protein [Paenibacillus alba]